MVCYRNRKQCLPTAVDREFPARVSSFRLARESPPANPARKDRDRSAERLEMQDLAAPAQAWEMSRRQLLAKQPAALRECRAKTHGPVLHRRRISAPL